MSHPGERAEYITGLRILARTLEHHPEIPLPYEGQGTGLHWFLQEDKESVAALARALPCQLDKGTWESGQQSYLTLSGHIAGLMVEVNAYRDAVCTRRVTGTEEVEVEEVVTPAVTQKVTKTVEVVEWECGSLLRPAAEPVHECGPGACTCGARVNATGHVTPAGQQ